MSDLFRTGQSLRLEIEPSVSKAFREYTEDSLLCLKPKHLVFQQVSLSRGRDCPEYRGLVRFTSSSADAAVPDDNQSTTDSYAQLLWGDGQVCKARVSLTLEPKGLSRAVSTKGWRGPSGVRAGAIVTIRPFNEFKDASLGSSYLGPPSSIFATSENTIQLKRHEDGGFRADWSVGAVPIGATQVTSVQDHGRGPRELSIHTGQTVLADVIGRLEVDEESVKSFMRRAGIPMPELDTDSITAYLSTKPVCALSVTKQQLIATDR